MDMQDVKRIIGSIAPIAASLVGGPLAGVAVKALGDAIGMSEPTQERVVAAIQSGSISPEQLAKIREGDNALKVRLAELGIDHDKIEADVEKAYLADAQNARKAHAGDSGVFWLGVMILVTFAIVIVACLWGSYKIMVGGITIKDVAVVAAVAGFVGTIVGYVAANAQQVISFYYGSSRGSSEKSRDMADAVKALGQAAK